MSKLTKLVDQMELEVEYWKKRCSELTIKLESMTAPGNVSWQIHLLRSQVAVAMEENKYLVGQLESRTRMLDEEVFCFAALADHVGQRKADEIIRKKKRSHWDRVKV